MAVDLPADSIQYLEDIPPRGMLVCISGPSGVGKGTVIEALKRRMPRLTHSVSVTTRPPRSGEQDGVDYFFRTVEEFEAMIENDEILEYDFYCSNYYGTPRRAVEEKLSRGEDVIMDVTVPGSLSILYKFDAACSIFLLPPSLSALRERLIGRGTENGDIIDSRLLKAVDEIEMAPKFDYILINNDVNFSAEEIRYIILAEKLRAIRRPAIEQKVLNR